MSRRPRFFSSVSNPYTFTSFTTLHSLLPELCCWIHIRDRRSHGTIAALHDDTIDRSTRFRRHWTRTGMSFSMALLLMKQALAPTVTPCLLLDHRLVKHCSSRFRWPLPFLSSSSTALGMTVQTILALAEADESESETIKAISG